MAFLKVPRIFVAPLVCSGCVVCAWTSSGQCHSRSGLKDMLVDGLKFERGNIAVFENSVRLELASIEFKAVEGALRWEDIPAVLSVFVVIKVLLQSKAVFAWPAYVMQPSSRSKQWTRSCTVAFPKVDVTTYTSSSTKLDDTLHYLLDDTSNRSETNSYQRIVDSTRLRTSIDSRWRIGIPFP
jgi:hypothetical protein